MKDEAREVVQAITSHPKTTVAVTTIANANVWWLEYGEPIVKACTSVLGLVALSLLVFKHVLDIKKQLCSDKKKSD